MAGLDSVPDDQHGSAAYRTRVGAAMAARAWATAATEASRWVRPQSHVTVNGAAHDRRPSSRA